jgi:hypothetical protein
MQAVEDQGGEHLDRTCEPPTYAFKQHEAKTSGDAWKFQFTGSVKKVTFPSCGHSALFKVPYVGPQDDEMETVTVCAVEDAMGLWPRFADQVAEG